MSGVTYRAVYLRKQTDGGQVFAVDPGDGRCDYITLPSKVEDEEVSFGARPKSRSRPMPFAFGDKVNITIEEPE